MIHITMMVILIDGAVMIRKVTAMMLRQNLGEILNEVQYRHDNFIITKAGKPTAAVIHIELFNKIKGMRDQFQKMTAQIAEAFEDAEPNELEKDIQEAVKTIRKNNEGSS